MYKYGPVLIGMTPDMDSKSILAACFFGASLRGFMMTASMMTISFECKCPFNTPTISGLASDGDVVKI